jgi:hypothetical protein
MNLYCRQLAMLGAFAAFAATGSAVANAATTAPPAPTSICPAPVLSQPFVGLRDTNLYALAPGQTPDNFTGAGWTLSGGASIVQATLADGATGNVLDLPSGSEAVSPVICVASDYPVARMMVRNLKGAEGVSFNVQYQATASANTPHNTGQVHGNGTGWTTSDPVNLQPQGNSTSWQLVRLVLIGKGNTSHFQVYNIYVDPRLA